MGGAEKVATLAALELVKRGHEVWLVTYYPDNDMAALLKGSGVRTCTVAGRGSRRLADLRRALGHGRFDVIHAYKVPAALWGMSALLGLPRPALFLGQHALVPDSRLVRLMVRAVPCSGWIVPSEAAAKTAIRYYGVQRTKVHVVPNPVVLPATSAPRRAGAIRNALGLNPDTLVVSIVANLHRWKNYPMFLRVAERIRAARPDVVFLVAGRDQLQGEIHAECHRRGLTGAIKFLGHVDDVTGILAATDVMVITSPLESFCLALAEAGALGVACVSTDNGGAREIISDGETGFIVACDDDRAMAEKVLKLLADDNCRRNFGAAARSRIHSRFEPATIAEQLETLYALAMKNQPTLALPN